MCACVELIVLMCYCAFGGVRTWEGLVRVIAFSLKECLSVFKPVQHAARQSLLKRHNDAQQHPRGILQTRIHTYAAHTETERTFTDTNIPHLHQCLLPRSSDHNKVHLLSFGWRTIRWFFLHKEHLSSRRHSPCPAFMSPSFFICILQFSDGALWTSRN